MRICAFHSKKAEAMPQANFRHGRQNPLMLAQCYLRDSRKWGTCRNPASREPGVFARPHGCRTPCLLPRRQPECRVGFGWLCAVWVDLSTARAYVHKPMGHMPVYGSPVPATGPMHGHPYGHMHTRRVRLGPAGWDLGGFVPFGSI
jgi:hypothetical protein